jgi:hypothetical protein
MMAGFFFSMTTHLEWQHQILCPFFLSASTSRRVNTDEGYAIKHYFQWLYVKLVTVFLTALAKVFCGNCRPQISPKKLTPHITEIHVPLSVNVKSKE